MAGTIISSTPLSWAGAASTGLVSFTFSTLPALFDVLIIAVFVRSTGTIITGSPPVTAIAISDSTFTTIYSQATYSDIERTGKLANGTSDANSYVAIFSLPVSPIDTNGNSVDAIPSGAMLVLALDSSTYSSDTFNVHATVIRTSKIKYTAPTEGTSVAETWDSSGGAGGGFGSPSSGYSSYPLIKTATGLAHTDDLVVMAMMTTRYTGGGSTAWSNAQPQIAGGGGAYGTVQDSDNSWTGSGTDIAFAVATKPDPSTSGDSVNWIGFVDAWIGITACYLIGPVTPIHIVTPPAGGFAKIGTTRTFTVSAVAGVGALTYQWQISTDGGTTWTNIAGATSASYTTPALTLADSGSLFRCATSDDD